MNNTYNISGSILYLNLRYLCLRPLGHHGWMKQHFFASLDIQLIQRKTFCQTHCISRAVCTSYFAKFCTTIALTNLNQALAYKSIFIVRLKPNLSGVERGDVYSSKGHKFASWVTVHKTGFLRSTVAQMAAR